MDINMHNFCLVAEVLLFSWLKMVRSVSFNKDPQVHMQKDV